MGMRLEDLGTMTVRTSAGVDPAKLAALAATAPHTLSVGVPAPSGVAAEKALVSVRVLVETPNPTRGSQGNWRAGAALARRQRKAVEAVLFGVPKPAGPWVVTITRAVAGTLDDDNLRPALKHVRDQVGVYLLGGKPGEHDDSPLVTWCYEERRGKRNAPAVDVEIRTR